MSVHIEGQDLDIGKYEFNRYTLSSGTRKKKKTYKIEKTKEGYIFYDSSKPIEKEIRRIEFIKSTEAFIWPIDSRIGSLFMIETPTS